MLLLYVGCSSRMAKTPKSCLWMRTVDDDLSGRQVLASKPASREILLWMTPSEAPKALQTSECSELLDPMRAILRISAQH